MSPNLMIGLGAIAVGLIAIVAAFLPAQTPDAPGVRVRRQIFQVVTYGLVPIVAGTLFLAAWWQEAQAEDRPETGRAAERALP